MCGGRDYDDYNTVSNTLGHLHKRGPVSLLIHGGARGADSLAGEWAEESGVPVKVYEADWKRLGKAAGFIRNATMLKHGKPDMVIAFPGGPGTDNMVKLADKQKGVTALRVYS